MVTYIQCTGRVELCRALDGSIGALDVPAASRIAYARPVMTVTERQRSAITLNEIRAAGEIVYRTLRPTPLLRHPLLDAETGLTIYVKHENHNPTGAFKVRGGLNLVARLTGDERRGVITATTGNHGQSIAMACRQEGVPCTIVVPAG